ncbi:MAG: glycosyltransferase family 2 protein [bacterium]
MGKLSIIVPVYNEVKTIKSVLDYLINLQFDKEIIVVNDGSTDGTSEILHAFKHPQVKILEHVANAGKGAAIINGIRAASGEVVAVQDADLEYKPDELIRLAEPIFKGEVDVVFGSRFLQKNPRKYLRFYIGNKIMSLMISLIGWKHITDTYTCYKMFKRDIINSFTLSSRGFEIEAELSILVARGKYRFKEMPISYNPRTIEEGKKINWKDAVKGILTVFKTRFKK